MTGIRSLTIIGAGGLGHEVASMVGELEGIEVTGFLDDDDSLAGATLAGISVLGPLAMAASLDTLFVLAIASPKNPRVRERVARRLGLPDDRYATLVHPSASVGEGCSVGPGSILFANCVLTADVEVGRHVVAMPGVVMTHGDRVGDFATFGAKAALAGRVSVGSASYVGSGSTVREDTAIGRGAVIGMGSVVLDDVIADAVVAGVPARPLG